MDTTELDIFLRNMVDTTNGKLIDAPTGIVHTGGGRVYYEVGCEKASSPNKLASLITKNIGTRHLYYLTTFGVSFTKKDGYSVRVGYLEY